MQTLLLTGPPGAGKTAVLGALMSLFEAEHAAYAAVEVEALALVHPWPDNDAAFAHLRFVATSFRDRGYPTLLLTATVEDAEYLAQIREALEPDHVICVRLEAPPDVLRSRVSEREPDDWVGLQSLLHRIEPLAESIAALPGMDVVVSTDKADPRAVAERLWVEALDRGSDTPRR